MKYIFLFFLSICLFSVNGQTKLDSLNEALNSTSGKSRFEILYALTMELYKTDPDLALKYVNEALKIAEDYNDQDGLADCLNFRGKLYNRQTKYDSAIIFFRKALDIRMKTNATEKIIRSHGELGNSYLFQGDFTLALKFYEKGLFLSRKSGYRKWEARFLLQIGDLNNQKGNFDIAIENCQKALKISEEIEDKYNIGLIFQRIGAVYFYGMQNYPKALEYYSNALESNRETGDRKEE